MAESAGYGLLTFVGGGIFLGLTFWLVFMVVKLFLIINFQLAWWVSLIAAVVAGNVCAAIFIDVIRAARDDMTFLPVWLWREYIGIGPRLILESLPAWRDARTWKNWDMGTNAKVLYYLGGRDGQVHQVELQRVFGTLDWERLKRELKLLPGVIFFHPDERRIALTLPLRLQIRLFRGRKRVLTPEPEPEPQPVPAPAPEPLSPTELLGVAPNAGVAQIKAAYRQRIKECHPDRFAGMDELSRAQAEEWTKQLNAAYETLLREARGGS